MTDDLGPAIDLATRLRNTGIRVQIHGEQKKFKQKMSYADKIGVPYVIFLGEEEVQSSTATVKNMRSGEQVKLPFTEVLSYVQAGLEILNQGAPVRDKGVQE